MLLLDVSATERLALHTNLRGTIVRETLAQFNKGDGICSPWDLSCYPSQSIQFLFGWSAIVVDKLLVRGFGWVELGELVALVVWSHVESWESLLATDDEGTLDNGVVVLSVDGSTAEDVLARALQAVVEAADQVVGHESHGQLVVVLVHGSVLAPASARRVAVERPRTHLGRGARLQASRRARTGVMLEDVLEYVDRGLEIAV